MYTPHDGQVTYHHDRLPLSLQLNDNGSRSLNHVHIGLSPDARVPAKPIRRRRKGRLLAMHIYDCIFQYMLLMVGSDSTHIIIKMYLLALILVLVLSIVYSQ
jgi:hypothetical protein